MWLRRMKPPNLGDAGAAGTFERSLARPSVDVGPTFRHRAVVAWGAGAATFGPCAAFRGPVGARRTQHLVGACWAVEPGRARSLGLRDAQLGAENARWTRSAIRSPEDRKGREDFLRQILGNGKDQGRPYLAAFVCALKVKTGQGTGSWPRGQ